MDNKEIVEEYLFEVYKDKAITNKDLFIHGLKNFRKQIDLRELYTRIVNYQIDTYGNTLRIGFDRIPKKKKSKIGKI